MRVEPIQLRTRRQDRSLPEHVVPHWYMYPPKSSFGPIEQTLDISEDLTVISHDSCSVYVHIPFCGMKCSFCSLFTTPDSAGDSIDVYVDCLVREMRRFGERLGEGSPLVDTVYFGGGTPSLLSGEHLTRIMSALRNILPFAGSWTGSVEFSPDTVTAERVAMWREAGFGRVSLGVQTFDDKLLATMRRGHSGVAAANAVRLLHEASFTDVNVDLIFGTAGQEVARWVRDLDEVVQLGPTSCTFHPAAAHSKTALEHKSRFTTVEAVDKRRLHRQTIDYFEAQGWTRTSVLSYSRTGQPNPLEDHEADGRPTLGFGVSARSYFPTKHLSSAPYHMHTPTKRVLQDYYDLVNAGELPVMSIAALNAEERLRRKIVLDLHRGWLSLDAVRALDAFIEDDEGGRVTRALVDGGRMIGVSPDVVQLTALGAVEAGEIGFTYSSAAVRAALSRASRGGE